MIILNSHSSYFQTSKSITMKEEKIKFALDKIAAENDAMEFMTDLKKAEITDRLIHLTDADSRSVLEIIESSSTCLKESIDFSDTSYLLDLIAQAINEGKG